MEKYYELTGYWNLVGEYNFSENKKWKGQIILEQDGWFEGIAYDSDYSKNTYRMIFGMYYPEKGIYMYKMAPRTLCEPQIICGTYNENGLEGEMSALSFSGAVSIGVSRIKSRQIEKEEIPVNFEEQLEIAKEKTDANRFYEMFYEKRKNVSSNLQYVKTAKM